MKVEALVLGGTGLPWSRRWQSGVGVVARRAFAHGDELAALHPEERQRLGYGRRVTRAVVVATKQSAPSEPLHDAAMDVLDDRLQLAGRRRRRLFEDALGSLVLLDGTIVDPAEAQVPRVNPVRGNPTKTEPINGGDYSARAIVLGVGVNYKF